MFRFSSPNTVGPDKIAFLDPEKITVLGVRKNAGPIKLPLPNFAVLGAQMGPDRPNFKSYFDFIALQPVGTVPGPFRATFGLPAKSAPAKNTNFALEGYNRFMRPSWVRWADIQ